MKAIKLFNQLIFNVLDFFLEAEWKILDKRAKLQ